MLRRLAIPKFKTMVFRRHIEDLKTKGGASCEPFVMVGSEACAFLHLPSSLVQEKEFIWKNWQLLKYILRSRDDNLLNYVENALPDKDILTQSLDVFRQSNKKQIIGRAGGNQDGQASDDSFLPGLPDDTALDILAWCCRSDYPMLSSLNKKYKSLIDSGDLYRLRRRLEIVEHWVYISCILMPWVAFDPAKGRWMTLPRVPCDDCFTYADKESLAVGTQLLVFGQELLGFAIWMYRLPTRDWSRCPLMNLPRCLFGSSSLGEIAIVAGGSGKNGCVLKSAELYNSELGSWVPLPDMNSPRKLCSGFFMDGKFYVIGGMSNHTDCLTCGEEYNMETHTWKRIKNMYPGPNMNTAPAMRSPPLVAVVNNQLYSADQATNEVKKYVKANNSWRVVKTLPVRADCSNGWGLAFKACGDKLLVIGGHRGPQGEVILLHSWEPEGVNAEENDWSVLSVMERAGTFVCNCAVMGC